MKLKASITNLFLILGIVFTGTAQTTDLIMWDNGDATLLSDIDKVNIVLIQGKTIKGARIYSFQKTEGTVTYVKDGTLHDKNMNAIKYIEPGKNAKVVMVFGLNNEPLIKNNENYDYTITGYAFKTTYFAGELRKKKQVIPVSVDSTEIAVPLQVFTSASDTLVKADGEVIAARIIHMNAKEVRYKRADLLDGPVFNLPNSPYTEVHRYNTGVKVILKH